MKVWFATRDLDSRILILLKSCLVNAIALSVVSCGGGGSSGAPGGASSGSTAYTISLSVPSLAFSEVQFLPESNRSVAVTFNGAGVVVGTLPGQAMPGWLSVTNGQGNSSAQATFFVIPRTAGLAPGNYSFTLRFVTGDANGDKVSFVDLPITLALQEGFSVSQSSVSFTAIEGTSSFVSTGTPNFRITGANVSWSATAPSWVRLSSTSGKTPQRSEWGRTLATSLWGLTRTR